MTTYMIIDSEGNPIYQGGYGDTTDFALRQCAASSSIELGQVRFRGGERTGTVIFWFTAEGRRQLSRETSVKRPQIKAQAKISEEQSDE